jgi:hypothetical protein
MSSVFGSTYHYDHLYSLMENVAWRTGTCFIDEHLDGYVWITAWEIKYGTERLMKQKQCQIYQ